MAKTKFYLQGGEVSQGSLAEAGDTGSAHDPLARDEAFIPVTNTRTERGFRKIVGLHTGRLIHSSPKLYI